MLLPSRGGIKLLTKILHIIENLSKCEGDIHIVTVLKFYKEKCFHLLCHNICQFVLNDQRDGIRKTYPPADIIAEKLIYSAKF